MSVERIVPKTNAWRESYADHLERYRTFQHLYKGKKVLDAACGVGYGSSFIADSGAESVTGLDIDDEALAYAQNNFQTQGVRFMKGDCTALPFENATFDMIVSFETLEHIRDVDKVVSEFARCLKPGGCLVASTPNRLAYSMGQLQKDDNPFHVNEMTLGEFRSLMGRHLTIEKVLHQSSTLAHVLAAHIQALDLALERSLVVKMENILRRLFGKQTLSVAKTRQALQDVLNLTPEPLVPLPSETLISPDILSIFVIEAHKPL
jgi:2-polyprenyl-3-methyl-5-hydroxy-6-metoxy-1,4-benzoquinol methylase